MSTFTIALAGNPNTGKSTLFNTLTGLRQHTGNWPGKTVLRAEGDFEHQENQFKVIDLPGTYSLYSNSADEEVARNYILFEKPDVTVVVIDATALKRNLNLALQIMEMTGQVIVCVNLIDEAKRKGIHINEEKLARTLGVPVVKISARNKTGINTLLDQINKMCLGQTETKPYQIQYNDELEEEITNLIPKIQNVLGTNLPLRWIALRILDGDTSLIEELKLHLTGQKEVQHLAESNPVQPGCH
ncbi:FeoB small GTPase domain-containing protein [Cytobacillus sp. IB215665]|uniref:FeoB small GTPase domain-containing protein n=1 Tax=Cytobacillus sp. IB215665 TaxID=3097357 RepID=UPI002A1833D1|nr:FeoB small GTPase domain-containing protein [Cytobacillus sp. IB215665]MDX8363864.1 FeoB small GTPase domain-containing protein [Cytobacillus sp. IB215665]